MKKGLWIPAITMLGAVIALAGAQHGGADSLQRLLPADGAIGGWTQEDTARVYEGQELYALIDGGADLFLEYGFRRSLAAEYQSVAGETIRLEIYQMSDAGAAYGIYTLRSGENPRRVDIGQEGCEHPYFIMFWKGPFYVSVASSDSTDRCRHGIESLAGVISAAITVRGVKPPLAGLLPLRDMKKAWYVRGFLGLLSTPAFGRNEFFPVADAVVGKYRDHLVAYMRYGDERLARERADAVSAALNSSDRARRSGMHNGIARYTLGDTRTLCSTSVGRYIVISLSSSESIADSTCLSASLQLRKHD